MYFDRISRRANGLLDAAEAAASQSVPGSPQPSQAPLVSNPMSPSLITHGMDRFHPFGNQDYDRRPMEGVDPPSYSLGKPDADTSAPQDPGEEFEFTMSKKRKRKVLIINSYNVHRLLITGVMVASKLFSDVFFLNSHYAKVNFVGCCRFV